MTKEDKKALLETLKAEASQLKRDVDYYNAMQLALKLVLNGSYGAFATPYFVLYNKNVAGTITAQGRDLTKTMDKVNEDYWYNQWHLDFILHRQMHIRDVTQIAKTEPVSIYADTDSLFVSFLPAIEHCEWKDIYFNKKHLSEIDEEFIVLAEDFPGTANPMMLGHAENMEDFEKLLALPYKRVYLDGRFAKDRKMTKILESGTLTCEPMWNWAREVDFIHGLDLFRYAGYFTKCLEEYAGGFGVENKEDFELERISESIISLAKKKYIQHVAFEDGIPYERLSYLFPKGVELVRSSTPAFARDKIINIVKYLFANSDSFNIKDLLALVKSLRKEFELADIDDISMQSSCSNYSAKVINDKQLPLQFVQGAHFAVKASAYHNYLISQDEEASKKYEPIKSGTKIKYYYCKNKANGDIFAYIRGSYPIEVAPSIDYDTQFEKSILSPINTIIEPLGMPEITARLTVVMDIFGGFGMTKKKVGK